MVEEVGSVSPGWVVPVVVEVEGGSAQQVEPEPTVWEALAAPPWHQTPER